MDKILVTGGAGFIGSHTVVELVEAGYEPVILDDFSNSERSVISGLEKILGKPPILIEGDACDKNTLRSIFEDHPEIAGVIHFAAYKFVNESVEKPLKYYRNNVGAHLALLDVMKDFKVSNMVFSSSCTVYGDPDSPMVSESTPVKAPASPYGHTKQICEDILREVTVDGIRSVLLRYFNPIGAHPTAHIGELPIGVPNNLVPFITQATAGERGELVVFGDDYPTPDGSCIRDFIHVVDLAKAHVKALSWLDENPEKELEVFNLGTGKGVSVLELINTFEEVTGEQVPFKIGSRRAGDIPEIYADVSKAREVMGWKTMLTAADALRDAWKWQKQLSENA